jgi:nitric oxide dioxygenase
MPLYYDSNPATEEDISKCKLTWAKVQSGTSLGASDARKLLDLDITNGEELFKQLYFKRFFDVHPDAKPMFSQQAVASGRFIVSMMSMCFNQLQDPKAFRQALVAIAEDHCGRGIRAVEYSIVGEVLMWAIQFMLGTEYDRSVESSWIRLYSSMLRVIVPLAVEFEHQNGRIDRVLAVNQTSTASLMEKLKRPSTTGANSSGSRPSGAEEDKTIVENEHTVNVAASTTS